MGYGKEITIKMVNKKYKDSYAIENLIKYTVTDKKRKKDCRYRGGHGVYYMNAKKAAEQFRIVQRYYKKQTGKRVHHMIISFEEGIDDLYAMDSLAKIIVYDILREYQSVYAIHEDILCDYDGCVCSCYGNFISCNGGGNKLPDATGVEGLYRRVCYRRGFK